MHRSFICPCFCRFCAYYSWSVCSDWWTLSSKVMERVGKYTRPSVRPSASLLSIFMGHFKYAQIIVIRNKEHVSPLLGNKQRQTGQTNGNKSGSRKYFKLKCIFHASMACPPSIMLAWMDDARILRLIKMNKRFCRNWETSAPAVCQHLKIFQAIWRLHKTCQPQTTMIKTVRIDLSGESICCLQHVIFKIHNL